MIDTYSRPMASIEIMTTWSRLGFVALSAAAMVAGIVVYVRIVGLRSFSKMTSFDFAVTVAIGSIVATVAMSGSSLIEGLLAVGILLAVQVIIAIGRRSAIVRALVDNTPLLLMVGPQMIEENLRRARVSEADLREKLRESNVLNYGELRYVVLETTGDVSVVRGDGYIDPDILEGVVDADRIFGDQ